MTILLSLEAKTTQLKALANFIDQGSKNATFIFYSSNKPASTSTVINSNDELVTLTLPKPCLKNITDEYIELLASNSSIILKNATAIWARLYNGNGKVVADFEVGTDIKLSDSKLILGGTLSLDSIVIKLTE